MLISQQIRRARSRAGLSQTDLARILKTTPSAVSRMESPRYNRQNLATLHAIAKATGTRLSVRFVRPPLAKAIKDLAQTDPFGNDHKTLARLRDQTNRLLAPTHMKAEYRRIILDKYIPAMLRSKDHRPRARWQPFDIAILVAFWEHNANGFGAPTRQLIVQPNQLAADAAKVWDDLKCFVEKGCLYELGTMSDLVQALRVALARLEPPT